jgi:chromosome partitioning protein
VDTGDRSTGRIAARRERRAARKAEKAGKGAEGVVSRETSASDGDVSRETASLAPVTPPPATRVLAVANQKGGVGKTTSAVNVAAALGLFGMRVLCIDLDPQGNASTALGIDPEARTPGIYEVMIGDKGIDDVLVPCPQVPNVMVVPAAVDLAGAEVELVTEEGREYRLARALEASTTEFDYIIIDCPPALGLLTINGLTAAREVMIPIQCEYYALEGLGQLLSSVELVAEHLNNGLRISTILLTMYDSRLRLADQVVAEVRAHFQEAVLQTLVPRSVRVAEAPSYASTVVTYDQASRGAQAYLLAARELAEQRVAPTQVDLTATDPDVSRETADAADRELAQTTGGQQ